MQFNNPVIRILPASIESARIKNIFIAHMGVTISLPSHTDLSQAWTKNFSWSLQEFLPEVFLVVNSSKTLFCLVGVGGLTSPLSVVG